jgi:hypothetical protein
MGSLENFSKNFSFNNANTKEHFIRVMTGGSQCDGTNIYKHTMQTFTTSPKVMVKELFGGAIVMPSQYFNPDSRAPYNAANTTPSSNYADITQANIKQALPMSLIGGGTQLKKIVDGNMEADKVPKALKKLARTKVLHNMDKFVTILKSMPADKKMSKKAIDAAFKKAFKKAFKN